MLAEQFGSDYDDVREFQRKASAALRKVKLVYPALKLDFVRGCKHYKGRHTPPPIENGCSQGSAALAVGELISRS